MPSIVNALFSGRSGIASHGTAIGVVGDNISNSSTPGFKASRAEFKDLIAGGQAAGKVVGSGSQTAAVSTIMEQGSFEFTGRTLDVAIDGNGFFAVEDANGGRFYTRAGNFKVDTSGNIIDQNGLFVMGYPAGGSGALDTININTVSQANIATQNIRLSGNVDASATPLTSVAAIDAFGVPLAGAAGANPAGATYDNLNSIAAFSTVVDVFDSLGASHTVTTFFFHTSLTNPPGQYTVRSYVNAEETGNLPVGGPRQISDATNTVLSGTVTMSFANDGSRTGASSSVPDKAFIIPWNNGSDGTATVNLFMDQFTQYASPSSIKSISQDGQGIGNVTSLLIDKDGAIFAKLSNGQSATIGTMGLVNFSNPEGLSRIGNNLLQQSPSSGEPLIGRAQTGTFGSISSGSIELSTVDIANEFVKLITLQRGFQANSRIITTINQLLNEIIQLA